MNNRYSCYFELPRKGIYFEVDTEASHVSFSNYKDSEFLTEVCLEKDDVVRLIEQLQSYVSVK
ncbi:hypothetical protein HUB98_05950 [Paenibacillus barcinonensis]|uniref:Uncharacterized protein n=1 Tax=Paenibacillus barcinonensis TaxID=198119 RepID=A0A2V4VNY0_PAEBA|nr:hypothetical protein [Paenibacillus barcinonensis]PYE51551.1 hypothetical protein DFQ00_102345 [Paenibacillus barcinonensis]QKS55924.1 hypothetical protein HUB98_05950 [Paenibacillus barcinonensis]